MMHPRGIIYFKVLLVALLFSNSILAGVVPAPPQLKASSYLVVDFQSGRHLVEHNIDERVEPASLTKMMTVYVVARELAEGNVNLEDMVIVSEKAWRMTGSRMFIEVDKEVSIEELLKGVIVQSGNDASVALAEHISGSEEVFAQVMNQYAAELGMTATNFMNSTGLPHPDHYTTARDLVRLAQALIEEHPEIYRWHSIRDYTFNGIKQHNRNQMLWRDDSVDGIKTGHTESAGYCLVASARRGDMRLISVVMGTDGMKARTRATQSLLNFSFRFYETHKLYHAGEAIAESKVWKANVENFKLGIQEDLFITISRGKYKKLDAAIELSPTIVAPVGKDEVKGTLNVMLEGEKLASRPLVSLEQVEEGSFLRRLKDDVRLLFE